jgi:hypothetical protein
MNNTMRSLFILLLLLACGLARHANAQTVCGIQYTYDEDGNRIIRDYGCVTRPGPNDPAPVIDPTIVKSIYPNPTTGVFHAEFSEPLSQVFFSITTIDGAMIEEREVAEEVNIVTFDIGAYAPGNYILTVIAGNEMESYTITKL